MLMFFADDSCVLLPPVMNIRPPEDFIQHALVPALTTKFGPTVNFIRQHISDIFIEEYSRIRRIDTSAGDTMRASSRPRHVRDKRDDTWVRVSLL